MTMQEGLVLVVEDSEEDIEAVARALGRSHPLVRLEFTASPRTVVPRLLDPGAERPALVLLDLNLPGYSGHSLLRDIRLRPELAKVPVVVFTSSTAPAEVEDCYAAGADSYIFKPLNFDLFRTVLGSTVDFWLADRPVPRDLPTA
ncbi:response regulator [Kitasatospora sp. NPDC089913]|uniref:response regulator n=1 Tax=Streptomycetaceae TaxID=2062 RepID=UPI00087B9183|nr:response regulator [Streptomyces sp. TLI_053]SDS61723.1 CheY chemotaxis protein or a CheY-like REC (receiver) domain [Streptomyces sp. TLI_053]